MKRKLVGTQSSPKHSDTYIQEVLTNSHGRELVSCDLLSVCKELDQGLSKFRH